MPRAFALTLAALLLACTAGPAGAEDPPAGGAGETDAGALRLRDRIVAVVDEDPILASDIDRAITLGLVERSAGESDAAFRRRIVDALIDQRVRFQEVARFGIEQAPVSRIEEQVQRIRDRFESEDELRRRLREVGLDLDALRQIVARQLMVWSYFEEFLGPRIFVGLEDIRQYYDETLVPEMAEQGRPAPPIEEVREDIRRVLKERRLNEAIEGRTEELRREADIVNYLDSEHEELPGVILRIDGGGVGDSPHSDVP
ncbi:MAG: hypothetical protein PVG07_10945 [Acidobacteriota bacterium]|jgi:hypothetical protein